MSVGIPSSFNHDVDLDVVGPVEISGIPSSYSINITHLPKIQIGVDPVTVNPMDISVRLKEFPSIRAHVPANFTVGLSVFGFPVVCLRLCGEAQVITEPYVPNPCERCEPGHQHQHIELTNVPEPQAVAKRAKRKK